MATAVWTWVQLFWGFFVANALGYGGGPASIPLMQQETVHAYHWLNNAQFANMLALGNALPGPIATKIAAAVGWQEGGVGGAIAALIATVVPSALAMILLLRLLNRYRDSSIVRGMTLLVQPVIAVLMAVLVWEIGRDSVQSAGLWQSLGIAAVSLWALTKGRIHPALLVAAAFVYGGLVIPHFHV
jgi:chromate transporter